MKIAIVGAGAIGGYLGTRLSLAGEEVTFIARNRNLAAIRAHGFRLRLEDGREEVAREVRAVQDMAEAGPQDAVVLATKAHQVADLLPGLRALFGPQTMVVSMLNGVPWWYFQRLGGPHDGRSLESVDPGGRIAAHVEAERVVGGIVYPAAELEAPGVVRLIEGNRFTLGELDGQRTERIAQLSQALIRAGFKAPVARDIRAEMWVKLLGNATLNPLSALTHATLEEICTHPASRALVATMMGEARDVAVALGVDLKVSIEQRIAGAQAVGAHKTSMLVDVEHGRALELAALVGAVIELGRVAGVPTPAIATIHAACELLQATLAARQGRLQVQPLA